MEVPLTSNSIHYLDRAVLDDFSSVWLIDKDHGVKIPVHPMTLSAFSQMMADILPDLLLQEDQDVKVITDLTRDELNMVVNFVSEGLLPVPMSELTSSPAILSNFKALGIDLKRLFAHPFGLQTPLLVKRENGANLDFDAADQQEEHEFKPLIKAELIEYDCDEEKPLKRLKRSVKKIKKEASDSDNNSDDDWKPTARNKKIKKEPDISPKPANPVRRRKKRNKLNKIDLKYRRECMELKRKYGDLVNVTIPDKSAPDPELLKDYKLPRSLSSYISSPADIEPLLSKNLNIDTEKQPYECTKCPKRFASQSKVDEHDTKYHFEHYLCPFCAKTYSLMKSEDFICHIYRHETGISKPHECIHCGFTCHRVRTMTCHIKTQGSFHTNRCPMCELSFESHGGFKQHLINVHPGQPGKICGYCGKVFNTDEDLTSHKSVEHVGIDNRSVGKKGVRKRLISSVSSSATTIKSESADPGALKICDLCGKEIKGSLKAHRDRVHGREENPVECPQCQKIFKSPWHLESHIKGLHDKYHCDLCGLMVSVKYKSRHFQQKHVSPEDRKFKCEVCAKGFSTGTGLRDHHNIHTGERPYVCKFCGKSFASSGNKEMHVRTTHLGHKRSYRS